MSDRIILWQALIPGGQVATVESLARVSFFPSGSVEHETSILLAAVAALLCVSAPEAQVVDALEKRAGAITELRASIVLVQGLLAARRGQRESARLLLASLETFDLVRVPPFHRQIATEWLMGEALDRHADAEVARLRQSNWLVPSTHVELTPWLRRVWPAVVEREADSAVPSSLWSPQSTPLMTALVAHAVVCDLPRQRLSSDHIERLALAWRNALRDPATGQLLLRRSLVSGELDAARASALLREQLVEDFVHLLKEATATRWCDVLELCEPLVEALRIVRQEALKELEAVAERLKKRVESEHALPPIDEWLDWNTLRDAYERLTGASEAEDRRLTFAAVKDAVSALAVWLANDRAQRPASHALFRWLASEAQVVGDAAAATLHRSNADITRDA